MNEIKLLEMLPEHFSQLRQMREIAKAEGKQFDKLDADIDDLLDQGFIETATWGLSLWERRYLLPVLEGSLDYERRRHNVLAKKRSNKASLIDILRAVEPTISLSWGGLVLPFTIESIADYYDFGELVKLLEVEKPSHLTYSFTIKPNGYTVRANRKSRNEVALQLISGTTKSGRYPRSNTRGESIFRNIGVRSIQITGSAELQRSAGVVSGGKDSPTAFGSVERERINIVGDQKTGSSKFIPSGPQKAGTIAHESIGVVGHGPLDLFTDKAQGYSAFNPSGSVKSGEISLGTLGASLNKQMNLVSSIASGIGSVFSCGSRVSGEGVL